METARRRPSALALFLFLAIPGVALDSDAIEILLADAPRAVQSGDLVEAK